MNKLDLSKMQESVLPEEVKTLVSLLLEGQVKTLIVSAELQENEFMEGIFVDMDGGESNRYAVIGSMESVKRDFMRMECGSRVDYVEMDDIVFEDDDDEDAK